MLIDGRLAALGAVAVGLTITWLRGRGQQCSAAAAGRQRSRHGGVQLLPRGRPLPSKPDELSLVSYNILCQRYANSRRLPHVFAQYLDPDYRWQRLQAELAAFGADLLALQEVTVDRWLELKEYMASLGYAAVVQARAAANGSDFMLALFYRPQKLRLVWHEERSRVLLACLAVEAEGPAQGQVVWVANVHLEGSPYRPNDRISQLRHGLQRLEHHIGSREAAEAADVIICGDFNSEERDSPYWLLHRGRLERNHTDACCPQVPTTKETISHPFALHEVYAASGHRQPFSRKVGREHAVLDFIWCSRHMPVSAVMRPLQPELRPLVDKCFMPNRWHPSDHLPIGAVIRVSPVGDPRATAEAAAHAASGRGGVASPQDAEAAASLNGVARSGSSSALSSPRSDANSSDARPA